MGKSGSSEGDVPHFTDREGAGRARGLTDFTNEQTPVMIAKPGLPVGQQLHRKLMINQ